MAPPARHAQCIGSVAALLLVAGLGTIEAQAIRVGPNIAVTGDSEPRRPVEAHLAVHPANPRHLLGVAIGAPIAQDWQEMLSRQNCLAFVSRDGGQSWLRHEFAIPGCLDPWVTIMPDGQAVFSGFASRRGELLVFHSPDGGLTWNDQPVSLGEGHDRPTTIADGSAPERASWLYIVSSQYVRDQQGRRVSTVFVARSTNGGRTFDAPVNVRANADLKPETPVVLADGTLVLSYVEPRDSAGNELPRRRAWVVRSSDGGLTFSQPSLVTNACGPPFRLSMLAADTSRGPFHDRLYFACNLPRESGVVVAHTVENGSRWSDIVRVHSAPADTTVRRKAMALAVNRDGILGIAWTDGRHAISAADCYDIYFSASLDGGQTFLPEQRVSQATSCPETTANGAIGRIFAPSGGDYIGMITDSTGRFLLLWSDARHGPFQLMTSLLHVNSAGRERD